MDLPSAPRESSGEGEFEVPRCGGRRTAWWGLSGGGGSGGAKGS